MRWVPALLLLLLLGFAGASDAQSGRAVFSGWVNFEDVAYEEEQPVATVRLVREGEFPAVYETKTDAHGAYRFEIPMLGRCRLEIEAEGYEPYSAQTYLPSDFIAHWAVELRVKKKKPGK
jgi:hypothetical protein